MIPGNPNIPTIQAFKTFIGIDTSKPAPIIFIIIKRAPPKRLLKASLSATFIGQ